MRWCWIDRFIEFESGHRARAIKRVPSGEEYLRDHFPAYPVMPRTLVLEGLAQVGGLLVFEHGRFGDNPILAKVPKASFFGEALPGDTLTYDVRMECIKHTAAFVTASCRIGDRLHAEAEIVFACFYNGHENGGLFDREVFMRMLRDLGAFEIGRAAGGGPLIAPQRPARPHLVRGTAPAQNPDELPSRSPATLR